MIRAKKQFANKTSSVNRTEYYFSRRKNENEYEINLIAVEVEGREDEYNRHQINRNINAEKS